MTAGRLEDNQSDAKANVERAPAEDDEERLRREVNRGECRHEEEAVRRKLRSSAESRGMTRARERESERGSSCMLTRTRHAV